MVEKRNPEGGLEDGHNDVGDDDHVGNDHGDKAQHRVNRVQTVLLFLLVLLGICNIPEPVLEDTVSSVSASHVGQTVIDSLSIISAILIFLPIIILVLALKHAFMSWVKKIRTRSSIHVRGITNRHSHGREMSINTAYIDSDSNGLDDDSNELAPLIL
eukprot:m.229957 g.229957  ORF g.229957 m.229957 type:complete len:158 (+) comp13888_c2_seq6:933-1406(+)